MDEYVVGLEDINRAKVSQAGGKGALLGEVLARGVPVPKGFCLKALAYDAFLKDSGIGDAVTAFHALPEGPDVLSTAETIHARILEAAIPAEVAFSLSTVYRTLGQRPRVVVRLSLACDDLMRSPVSGHAEPHLNVLGEKDLFQAVRDVWASIWQPSVITAAQRAGVDHARLRPAVLIQVMVHPVSSGTIFTADPGTGDRDRLVITAFWGMGQGSAAQATPDIYHVDRRTMALRYKRIVTKDIMVSASGIVPVPKNRRNSVVLKDPAIRNLCTMALGVEEILEEPAEIEWCMVTSGQTMVLEALPVGEIDGQPQPSPPPADEAGVSAPEGLDAAPEGDRDPEDPDSAATQGSPSGDAESSGEERALDSTF